MGKKKQGESTAPPSSVLAVEDAPRNPRSITVKASGGLKRSIVVFGDLSGFVINGQTKHVVCAHQRRSQVAALSPSAIHWGAEITCELGYSAARFQSVERHGWFEIAGGARFAVRLVDWPEPFELAANVAANSPEIAGEFTEEAAAILDELAAEIPPDDFAGLCLDALLAALPKADAAPDEFPEKDESIAGEHKCPKCGYEWRGEAT